MTDALVSTVIVNYNAGPFLRACVDSLLASPMRFSETPITAYRAPPMLGADTDAVLGDLGYTAEELAALRASGIT